MVSRGQGDRIAALFVLALAVGALGAKFPLGPAGAASDGRSFGVASRPQETEKWVFSTYRGDRDSVAGTDSIFPPVADIDHFVAVGKWMTVRNNSEDSTFTHADAMICRTEVTWPTADYQSRVYFNLDQLKAACAGKRVVSAKLWVRQLHGTTAAFAAGDSFMVSLDTLVADTASTKYARAFTNKKANQTTSSWNRPVRLPSYEAGDAWSPTLDSRNLTRERGPVALFTKPSGSPLARWMSADVTAHVQMILNGTPNAGWWPFGKRASALWAPYHFDTSTAARRPFLVVEMSADPYVGTWPGGASVAACFTQDDLEDATYTTHFVKLADSLGIKVTLAPELGHIDVGGGVKSDSLSAYLARGHEIASQGWYTNLNNGADKLPGDPDSTASLFTYGTFKSTVQDAAGIAVQLSTTRTKFALWGLPQPKTYVYPYGFWTTAYADSLTARGYIGARGTSIGNYADWIRVSADSCYPFRTPSSYTPFGSAAAGFVYQNGEEEATVRARIRALIAECKTRGSSRTEYNGILVFFGHGYTDYRFTELSWVISELQANGVYIDRYDNLIDIWRRNHIPPPVNAYGAWTK